MKILFVTGGVPSPIGQTHVLHLLKALSAEHELTVVSCDLGESYLADSDQQLHELARVTRVPMSRKNIIVRGIRSLVSLVPVAVQGFCFDGFRSAVGEVLRQADYDVVVFEQLVTAQYGHLAAGIPKLIFPVDAVSRIKQQRLRATLNPLRQLIYGLDYWMTERYEKRVYKEFDGILLVSDVDASYILAKRQVAASKIFVLPLVVDTDYFLPKAPEPESGPSLVFLGNMFNSINEDAILWFYRAVWQRLRQTFPALKLYIVGNDPSAAIRDLGHKGSQIFVTGYRKDIRPPIQNATVFISPLRFGTGIKNRMLIGMAMGKAIVASPLSIEGINVNSGRQVLVARGAEEFYQQIVILLQNADERKRLSHEARQFVERNHSLQSLASRFMNVTCDALSLRVQPIRETKPTYRLIENTDDVQNRTSW